MAIRFTKEELDSLGYVEVKPGVFKKLSPAEKQFNKAVSNNKPAIAKNVKTSTVTIGGKTHHYRSGWEVDYAKYCEFLKRAGQIRDWAYEPKRFDFPIKRGSNSYLPDFQILDLDGTHYWIEVKGYLSPQGATKLNRMAKYFPEETVKMVRIEEIQEIRKSGILEFDL